MDQQNSIEIHDIKQYFKQVDMKIQDKLTNFENTYKSYQSKV